MNEHPYYWLITAALIAATAASLSLTAYLIRRDLREKQQHQWDQSTHVDWDDVVARCNASQAGD